MRAYYHWVRNGVDFITLDNASEDQFDVEQLQWLNALLKRDEASPEIKTIVVGLHAALPGSFGFNHSMSDWAQGQESGRQVQQTRMGLLMLNVVHSEELYGNIVTTLRIKNIVPPSSEPRPRPAQQEQKPQ